MAPSLDSKFRPKGARNRKLIRKSCLLITELPTIRIYIPDREIRPRLRRVPEAAWSIYARDLAGW